MREIKIVVYEEEIIKEDILPEVTQTIDSALEQINITPRSSRS